MKKVFNYLTLFLLPLVLASCGEELVSKGTLSDSITTQGVVTMSSESCSGFHYEKPPVDILIVVDNSGSTIDDHFAQIKNQIGNIISTVSQDFDYHIYVAPLFDGANYTNPTNPRLKKYQLLISGDPTTVPDYNTYITTVEELYSFEVDKTQNNSEHGIKRVQALIDANKGEGKIFRPNSNLITVMISSGNDTSPRESGGNSVTELKNQIRNSVNTLNPKIFRFISFVPFTKCSDPFTPGDNYREVSRYFYSNLPNEYKNDPGQDSRNLCTGNYSNLFEAVNNSIHKDLVGHKYDFWMINPNPTTIEPNDIILKKKTANGSLITLSANESNGFKYIGYTTKDTSYDPGGEPKTGHMVQLFGTARVEYPDCIIAKTRTPTEYYGYVVLNRKPDVSTVKVEINGNEIPQSTTNGWSFEGYMDTINIKIKGPNNYNEGEPKIIKSGYVLKLNGSAIYSNSDTINVYYRPADL